MAAAHWIMGVGLSARVLLVALVFRGGLLGRISRVQPVLLPALTKIFPEGYEGSE